MAIYIDLLETASTLFVRCREHHGFFLLELQRSASLYPQSKLRNRMRMLTRLPRQAQELKLSILLHSNSPSYLLTSVVSRLCTHGTVVLSILIITTTRLSKRRVYERHVWPPFLNNRAANSSTGPYQNLRGKNPIRIRARREPQMMQHASGMSKEYGVHDQHNQTGVRLKLQILNEWIV